MTAVPLVLALLTLPAATAPFDQSATTIDEVLALGRPVVLAHTGGEDRYPGSTMYAFRNSVAAGVDVLDLNVTLSADDALVVHHDLTVDRTTNGTGVVAEMSLAELAGPRQRLLVHRRLWRLHRPAGRRLRPPRHPHR